MNFFCVFLGEKLMRHSCVPIYKFTLWTMELNRVAALNMPYQLCEIIRFRHTSISYTLAYIWQHTSTVCEHVRNDAHILYSGSCMSSHISISQFGMCRCRRNEYLANVFWVRGSWTVCVVCSSNCIRAHPRLRTNSCTVSSLNRYCSCDKANDDVDAERSLGDEFGGICTVRLRAHSGNTLDVEVVVCCFYWCRTQFVFRPRH